MRMSTRIAKDLASAGPKDLIHVDHRGRVRGPGRVKILRGVYWGLLVAILLVEAVLGYALFGPAGLSIAFALTLLVAWRASKQLALAGATDALSAQRYDEADEAFAKLAASKILPRLFRPIALGRQAQAREKAGDLEGALKLCREAIALYGKSQHAEARLARYQEARLLLRLRRLDEASALLAGFEEPEGELFRLHHHTNALRLAFLRGRHDLSDERLHELSTFALEINLAAPLIGLLGWAFAEKGDEDMAELMRETALDRDDDGAEERFEELWAWLRHGEPPKARVELEAEEELELTGDRSSSRARCVE